MQTFPKNFHRYHHSMLDAGVLPSGFDIWDGNLTKAAIWPPCWDGHHAECKLDTRPWCIPTQECVYVHGVLKRKKYSWGPETEKHWGGGGFGGPRGVALGWKTIHFFL